MLRTIVTIVATGLLCFGMTGCEDKGTAPTSTVNEKAGVRTPPAEPIENPSEGLGMGQRNEGEGG